MEAERSGFAPAPRLALNRSRGDFVATLLRNTEAVGRFATGGGGVTLEQPFTVAAFDTVTVLPLCEANSPVMFGAVLHRSAVALRRPPLPPLKSSVKRESG